MVEFSGVIKVSVKGSRRMFGAWFMKNKEIVVWSLKVTDFLSTIFY